MDIKKRENTLIKNTGILALGNLCSRILSFFLLPLYTNVLSKEDFGTIDVLQTIASFLIPFISLEINSAVFRFIIDKKDNKSKEKVISTGIFVELINILLTTIILIIINIFWKIQYIEFFIIYIITLTFLEMMQNIVRGFGDNKLYSVLSFLMTVVSLLGNIIMILVLKMKGESILIASSLSYITFIVIAFIKLKIWKYINKSDFSIVTFKEMIKYSLPLIPNAISWWIANTSDRIILLCFLGAESNGIYAAANKIPNIYTTIFNVYNMAWIETLSRSNEDENQDKFVNYMFIKSIKLFSCICIGIICCMSIFFHKIIGINYAEAYNHIYILLVAIFFNSICSLLGGIFTAFKKSNIIGTTTVIGAIVNIIINFGLINFIGLYAASISTLVSYIVIVILRAHYANKLITIKLPLNIIVQIIIALIITTVGYFYKNLYINIVILLLLFIWSFNSNKELIIEIISGLINKIKKINKKVTQ